MSRSPKQAFLAKLADKSALIGVIGLGYVGLPFAVEKALVGFRVLGFDANPARVKQVLAGQSYIIDVESETLARMVDAGLIDATDSFDRAGECDALLICVPTPLSRNLAPDLQYVEHVTREISVHLRPGQLVSLESTTYPGTTEEIILPILAEAGLEVDRDYFLAHSPERVDPGNQRYTTNNTMKVVGGVGPESLEVAVAFYSQTIQTVIPVSSAQAAELTKVFENTFRAVNIALVNEMALLCDRLGLNVWEVLDAAFTKPFGIMPFYPGPGVGGHCIPLDPHYLEWKAKEYNFCTRFIGLAGEINRRMPEFVLTRISRILNTVGLAMSRSKVLVLGAAYKKNLGDWRESPSIGIVKMLLEAGTHVDYHDEHVPSFGVGGLEMSTTPLTPEMLADYDLVVILTDHSCVDYALVVSHSKRVFDTRNATRAIEDPHGKVELL